MQNRRALRLFLILVAVPTSFGAAQAPSDQPAEYIQVITTTVKSGSVPNYESFGRSIVAAANRLGVPQHWSTSQVSLGAPGLTYVVVLPFNKWEDIDTWIPVRDILLKVYGPARGAQILNTGRAAIDRTETAVYRLLPDLSTRPKAFDPPPAFVHLFVTEVEPAMVPAWEGFLARIKAAQEKSAQAPTAVRRVAELGASNTYVTAVPFNKFAERDTWQTNLALLRDAYGEAEARSLDETRLKSTRSARQVVLTYRPDLSRPVASPPAAGR